MREIIKRDWDYSFIENDEKFILSVICGSVGLFEINIELNNEELIQYNLLGTDYIEDLAKAIQYSPSKFSERNISNSSSAS